MNKFEQYKQLKTELLGEISEIVNRFKMDNRVIDQLIEEGFLKEVTIRFNHLPDDSTICLAKGYCVEEDMLDRDTTPLAYLRLYKGLEQGLEHITGMTNEKLVQSPDFMSGYTEWLKKNHEKLTQVINPVDEEMAFHPLNLEEREYLISRDWYKSNLKIDKAIDEMRDKTGRLREEISLHRQMINLCEGRPSHKDNYDKSVVGKAEAEKELKIRERISDFLNTCKNKSTKIQEFYI